MLPLVAITAIILVGAMIPAVPVAVDTIVGESIQPDHALYGVERAGENIRVAVGLETHAALALERAREYKYAYENDLPEAVELLNESEEEMSKAVEKNEIIDEELLDARKSVLRRISELDTIPEETRTRLEEVIVEDYGIDEDLRTPLLQFLQYKHYAETYCTIMKNGEWHFERDFLGCANTKIDMTDYVDCDSDYAKIAIAKCEELGGTAVCDEHNAYCKR